MTEIKTYGDFFAWCEKQGLKSDRLISVAFHITPQSVRNWKAKNSQYLAGDTKAVPPIWLELSCLGFEAARRHSPEIMPSFPAASLAWFDVWRAQHRLNTLELTSSTFGITRQAVHNWYHRNKTPRWLPMACRGYEVRIRGGEEEVSGPAPVAEATATEGVSQAAE
ncbi:hypothetical protein ACFOY8_13415 [Thalassospira xianhensis]|uniref:Uncharacterized protein n=2 Tax=Thalassospira TaxID=168934 RepID=A0A285TSW2_9PROT|nr:MULTISPECIES: hypothetical protein [Thalassospira]RCK07812.1 hypothetical protein TH5_01875 [Thalassospira xianhensis MCCC 1A02616]SOC27048.1 hypothetical protein SAMN05428964_105259 [Thalassospira xiamenensis]